MHWGCRAMRRALGTVALVTAVALLAAGPAPAAPFPDVPPWHWAYQAVTKIQAAGLVVGYPTPPAQLVENSVTQVFDGFVHAQAPGAREWVERFTYDRPADWPGPFLHATLSSFLLDNLSVQVSGDAATAAFDATVAVREGGGVRTLRGPMRVRLRLIDGDWKADYATLAAGSAPSAVFR
jgi:hypothetical protein